MSILTYREALKDLPGGLLVTMRYAEEDRSVEIWDFGAVRVRVVAGSTPSDVRDAFNRVITSSHSASSPNNQ